MTATVAVLGAAGFIGSRTVEMLHLGGDHVRPVVRRPEALARSARFALDGRVADARDENALAAALAGCTYIVHAVAGDPRTIVDAVAPVYRAAAAASVRRIVYLSSASVHGQAPAQGTDETSPLSDRQPIAYNNAKVRAERRLAELRREGAVEVVVLRPGIVHGPRSAWIGGFADELLAGTAYLVDGGRGVCNAVYVDNVVHAVRLALEAPAADREAYLIGDAEAVTWADLCCPVAAALGHDLEGLSVPAPGRVSAWRRLHRTALLRDLLARLPRPVSRDLKAGYAEWRRRDGTARRPSIEVTEERAALHTCQTRLSFDKARRQLGYAPIVSFEEASRRAVAWLAFAGYPVVGAPAEGSGLVGAQAVGEGGDGV